MNRLVTFIFVFLLVIFSACSSRPNTGLGLAPTNGLPMFPTPPSNLPPINGDSDITSLPNLPNQILDGGEGNMGQTITNNFSLPELNANQLPSHGGVSARAIRSFNPNKDLDGDGVADLVKGAAPGDDPFVYVYLSSINRIIRFEAYTLAFKGGVNVAIGKVISHNSRANIVTAAWSGGGPHVRVWRLDFQRGFVEVLGFMAYPTGFPGGVSLALGDTDGDGIEEIITGAGPGGGPHAKIISVRNEVYTERFSAFVFPPGFTGGVNVAAGDFNGNGRVEVVFAAGPGGGPHVIVVDGRITGSIDYNPHASNPSILFNDYVYPEDERGGVWVAAVEIPGLHGIVGLATFNPNYGVKVFYRH